MGIEKLSLQHKHVARILGMIYEDVERNFNDSEYGFNVEYDVAVKLIARLVANGQHDINCVLGDVEEMVKSLKE